MFFVKLLFPRCYFVFSIDIDIDNVAVYDLCHAQTVPRLSLWIVDHSCSLYQVLKLNIKTCHSTLSQSKQPHTTAYSLSPFCFVASFTKKKLQSKKKETSLKSLHFLLYGDVVLQRACPVVLSHIRSQ